MLSVNMRKIQTIITNTTMKKSIKFLSAAILGLAAVACSSPEKMAEMAENVTVKCVPAVLEVVAGEINAEVAVTYPEDYFHPKAILEVTPVIVYEGGEAAMTPFVFQGEKVQDNYEVVPAAGATVTKKVSFTYVPGMEKSYLELRGVVKYKKKSVDLPTKKVADGANTTYMLVCKKGKLDLKADNYQEIIKQTAEGQILYTINSSYVRGKELKSQSIKDFQAALEEIKANERKNLVSTDVVAYASPDGKEDQNAKLSDNRSKSAEKAFNKVTKKNPVEGPVNVSSVAEDWEGFQELVAASDLQDKELIIRVLSMYSDPAVREKEIKNMSAVYTTLAKEVLPELRRARFIANVEYTNYTSEELLQLIEENIDILDETAILRAATLVKENEKKVALYKKAADKFNSNAAQYNLAVTYIKMDKLAEAKTALAACEKDADWNNAMGVVALRENKLDEASKYFAAAGNATAKENAAVISIINGDYKAAAAALANAKGFNAALAQLLVGNNAPAAALKCECATTAYLRAVAAARQGNAEAVKTNLEAAKKCEKLAERAAKDVEFAQYK
jgi:outer membrane protein OmpA-like peptidoglycan-associated protein